MKTIHPIVLCILLSLSSHAAVAQTALNDPPNPQTEQSTPVSKDNLMKAFNAQNWNETIRQADELLKQEPQNADILSMQAVAYANLSQYDKSLNTFEQALKIRPDDNQIQVSICGVQHHLKHPNVIDTCMNAAKLVTDNAELQHLTGTLLETAKRYPEARAHYEAAYKIKPDSAIYLTAITALDFKSGNNQKALEINEQAIQGHFANNPIIWLNLLSACNRTSQYEKTIDYANKSYDKFHDHYILAERAEAYLSLGQFEKAQKDFDAIMDKFTKGVPGAAKTQFLYARNLLALSCASQAHKTCTSTQKDVCCGRAEQALTILKSLKDNKSFKNDMLPVYLGHAHILNGELDAAESILTQAVSRQIDKDNASALASLAVALYHFNDARDKTAALRFYKQAVDASPDFSDPQKIRTSRAWAPRLVETLTQIQTDAKAQNNANTKKSGCSCDLTTQHTPFSAAAVLITLLCFLGLGITRRKA